MAYKVIVGTDDPGSPDPESIVVLVEPGVSMMSSTTTETRDGKTMTRSKTVVGGRELVLAAEGMWIGGEQYGPVKAGSVVSLGKDSVRIDGKVAEPRE